MTLSSHRRPRLKICDPQPVFVLGFPSWVRSRIARERGSWRKPSLALCVALCALLGGCRKDAPPPLVAEAEVTPAVALLPNADTAWAYVSLDAVREDPRLAPALASAAAGDDVFARALAEADVWCVVATDALFSDRTNVLEGAWEPSAIARELTSGENSVGRAFEQLAVPGGVLWRAEGAPWVVASDGARLLLTGPEAHVRHLLAQPRSARVAPESDAQIYVAPAPLLREGAAMRLPREELAEPVRAIERVTVDLELGLGLDVVATVELESAEAVAPARAALQAAWIVLEGELQAEPGARSAPDVRTVDERSLQVTAEVSSAQFARIVDRWVPSDVETE